MSESMWTDLQRLRTRRDEILACAANHGARNVRVFGSIARGEADTASDVDLLVDMEPGRSLLDSWGCGRTSKTCWARMSTYSARAA